MRTRVSLVAFAGALLVICTLLVDSDARAARPRLFPGADGWRAAGLGGIRGVTIGPIENGYHPGVGYGSNAYMRALFEVKSWGATWVSLTPFGRVGDLSGRGVDRTFEAPYETNRRAVRRAIEMAHAFGLSVMLVPHLWVESGQWRALIDPQTEDGWRRWQASYRDFALEWASIAEETGTELFSAGVELRSWVTGGHAPAFTNLLHEIRSHYHGLVTYSANWDDVDDTIVLGELDLIGINAFYPLTDRSGASQGELVQGGQRVAERIQALAKRWQKPILFTEIGYTTRPDPALRPWEWPDTMKNVRVDPEAQARAYEGLLTAQLELTSFTGFFVWRVYSDPEDVSQEAEWGFSPRAKPAERIVREAFFAHWGGESLHARQRW